ncbi:hypothetical protein SDC9_181719 [bioreactor metagenome]|uniref:Uncharacterized protein n=1 Tax=bioreactor metagenome TaxID=1076179 RepID=A0A645H6U9_9ZZZZ
MPAKSSPKARGSAGSATAGTVSSTPAILSAETEALGRMMNIMESMIKEKKICIAYCMKAIMSPMRIWDCATSWDPVQMTRRETMFMISIMRGIMTTMTRVTKSMVPVRSLFALSKRFSSCPCMSKALMTIMPVRFSRTTRLSRSMSFWMLLNRGRATANTTAITPRMRATARAMIHHIDEALPVALITPPMPMIGA